MKLDKESLGLLLLRLGVGGVFFSFGIYKLVLPLIWVGWIPGWMMPILPMSNNLFVYILGIIEVIVGAMTIIGYHARIAAIFAGLQLLVIIASFGFSDIMIRDAGLLLASISIFLLGAGRYSIDKR